MKKYYNMEFGTYQIKNKKILLSIDKKQFSKGDIEDEIGLSDLEDITYADERFSKVSIKEKDNKLIFSFEIDDQFKNLKNIHEEKLPVKLSIAKAIIKENVLETSGFPYVSINPASIWYLPMRTIKYTYRANNSMPQGEEYENFSKYKALVLYILTGANYQKLLLSTKFLKGTKKKNPYLEQIIEASTMEKLYLSLDNIEDSINYNEWKFIKNKDKKLKKIIYALLAFVLLSNVVTSIGTTKIQQAISKEKIEHVEKNQRNESLNELVDEALQRKDYKTATSLMLQSNISNKKIARTLLKHKQYKTALAYDSNLLETIIATYWKSDSRDKILDLKLSKEATKEQQDKLQLEKAIVAFNTGEINSNIAFIEDKNTILRIGKIYLENKDYLNTEIIVDKLGNLNYENEKDLLTASLTVKVAADEIKNINSDIDKLNSTDEPNKEIRLKEANAKLNTTQENLKEAQQKLKKIEGKINE